MILLLSKEDDETTTEKVIDWLNYYNAPFYRLNGTTFFDESTLNGIDFTYRGLDFSKINVVWLRRWVDEDYISNIINNAQADNGNYRKMFVYLMNELVHYSRYFKRKLANKLWITKPSELYIHKSEQLEIAKKVGLQIPATLITGNRNDLLEFKKKHGRIINKSISNPASFFTRENDNLKSWMLRTSEISLEDIHAYDTTFFPSLFQELIEKEFELRVFYLNRKFYSMAIFSQLDEKTQIDFRNYNEEIPNRTIPFKLPIEIETKLQDFIDELDFTSGSFDLIYSLEGDFIFLEINAVGQFGMTSFPTNYYLEKILAEHLIELNEHER